MKLLAIALWVLAGAALTGAVYWLFLITPESTAGALALSALLAASSLFLLAITVSGAVQAWTHGLSADLFRSAVSNAASFMPAALIALIVWWLVGRFTTFMTINSGPISAWFIARFGWSDVSGVFMAINWLANWARWVVAPLLGLSLMAAIDAGGWRSAAQTLWIRRALSPMRLGFATAWFALLVAIPWIYLAPWRPRGLPPNSLELLFTIGKLAVTAGLMAVGVSLMIREAAPAPLASDAP